MTSATTEPAGKQSNPQPRKSKANGAGKSQPRLKSARASTYQLAAVKWLWPSRFAIGKLGILAGLPDEGKGQILADMAARTTRASEWPCGEGLAPLGNVILLTADDGIEDTVVPRLLAADADLNRVEIVTMVVASGNRDRMFNLGTDLELLREKIAEVGDVKLVLIDPISAYLGTGKIDSFRTTDVRAVLGPLVDLANELRVAVVGIMHFNKKTDVTNALLRISDSLAFGAAARHVYAVVDDPENKCKLFARGKNNLAAATKALAYSFGVREVGRDPKTDQTIHAPHIIWHPKHVDVTATEAMQAATEARSPTARDEAKTFLADILANGSVTKNEIEEAAKANGIAERTLFRAKSTLKIIPKKDGSNGEWTWRLPGQPKRWDRV
ncbi:MAG: AAA family ATPase [Xanthobacteraceae bacterium]